MIDLVRIPQEEIQTIAELINIQVDNVQVILPCFLLIENQIDIAGEIQQFKILSAHVCACVCVCLCLYLCLFLCLYFVLL